MSESIQLKINGAPVSVASGSMVTAAVLKAESLVHRRSIGQEDRAPLCGMGICFECRVQIDGMAHQRACITPCRAGMEVTTHG